MVRQKLYLHRKPETLIPSEELVFEILMCTSNKQAVEMRVE